MYQPETKKTALARAKATPNSRSRRKLLDRQEPSVTPTPMEPKTNSGRTLNKQARHLATLKDIAATQKDMNAAAARGKKWEPNCKLRK